MELITATAELTGRYPGVHLPQGELSPRVVVRKASHQKIQNDQFLMLQIFTSHLSFSLRCRWQHRMTPSQHTKGVLSRENTIELNNSEQ